MRDEKRGGCASNCLLLRHVEPVWRRDTWGGVVGGVVEVCHQFELGPQNKDEHLTLIFMASSADSLLR